jgi:hypothetical protein
LNGSGALIFGFFNARSPLKWCKADNLCRRPWQGPCQCPLQQFFFFFKYLGHRNNVLLILKWTCTTHYENTKTKTSFSEFSISRHLQETPSWEIQPIRTEPEDEKSLQYQARFDWGALSQNIKKSRSHFFVIVVAEYLNGNAISRIEKKSVFIQKIAISGLCERTF